MKVLPYTHVNVNPIDFHLNGCGHCQIYILRINNSISSVDVIYDFSSHQMDFSVFALRLILHTSYKYGEFSLGSVGKRYSLSLFAFPTIFSYFFRFLRVHFGKSFCFLWGVNLS